jgi:hypothetical protein
VFLFCSDASSRVGAMQLETAGLYHSPQKGAE